MFHLNTLFLKNLSLLSYPYDFGHAIPSFWIMNIIFHPI